MALDDQVDAALQAGEQLAAVREGFGRGDRVGATVARYYHNLASAGVDRAMLTALVMQAGEIAWHAELCHGKFCGAEGS
jgi:hypothetical protein